jgi:hypothetical protein
MIYFLISILIIFYLIYLIKNSKSNFFYHKTEILAKKWYLLELVLIDFNFTEEEKKDFSKAYNYFIENQKKFDGATIVRDLNTINELDASAMLHDYRYILSIGIKDRIKADKEYLYNMLKMGVHPVSAYLRAYLLILINITGIYTIYRNFNN